MRYHNVAIEGCIGTGKTCLATMISERNHIRLLLERFKNNKHLKKFYEAKTKKEFYKQKIIQYQLLLKLLDHF